MWVYVKAQIFINKKTQKKIITSTIIPFSARDATKKVYLHKFFSLHFIRLILLIKEALLLEEK